MAEYELPSELDGRALSDELGERFDDITAVFKQRFQELFERKLQEGISNATTTYDAVEDTTSSLSDEDQDPQMQREIEAVKASRFFGLNNSTVVEQLEEEIQQLTDDFQRQLQDEQMQLEEEKGLVEVYRSTMGNSRRNEEKSHKEVQDLQTSLKEALKQDHIQRSKVQKLEGDIVQINQRYEDQMLADAAKYRALFQQLADLKGNIRVLVRIRPGPKDGEQPLINFHNPEPNAALPWQRIELKTEEKPISHHGTVSKTEKFDGFERVFGMETTNDDIFDEIADVAQSAVYGKPVTVIGYGQTGSGKTYTFLNGDGIVLRYLRNIFQLAEDEYERYSYSFMLSVGEIYLDKIYDLLHDGESDGAKPKKEQIRDWGRRTQRRIDSIEVAESFISAIVGQRETASTKGNAVSSRSHLVLSLSIKKQPLLESDPSKPVDSVINFVDLAGSESPGKDGATGIARDQGVDINLALSELRGQIRNLQEGKRINNGSHSLSKVLKSTLTPASRVILMVMISPLMANLQATRHSLRMAADATKASVAGSGSKDKDKASSAATPSPVRGTPARATPKSSRPGSTRPIPRAGRGTPASTGRPKSDSEHDADDTPSGPRKRRETPYRRHR